MIRLPAAEKLAKVLLEMRPSRLAPLSKEFFTATAKIIMAHVELDEQRQRGEKITDESPPQMHETNSKSNQGEAK